MERIKSRVKTMVIAKVENLKQWVYKHYVGVYIAIGVSICIACFLVGFGYGLTV